MIDIVGCIKIDESKPERIKYLVACIRSFLFLKNDCTFHLFLEEPSERLLNIVKYELTPFKHFLTFEGKNELSYGQHYRRLLRNCKEEFVLNFFEDHFCLLENGEWLRGLLGHMKENRIQVCKASFHEIEQTSALNVYDKKTTQWGQEWVMDENNYIAYCRAYGERFYLGVNFITTRDFALDFWKRNLGKTPHPYELPRYDITWQHKMIIPRLEICAAIDDDHGAYCSCLLSRPKEEKFTDIFHTIRLYKKTEHFLHITLMNEEKKDFRRMQITLPEPEAAAVLQQWKPFVGDEGSVNSGDISIWMTAGITFEEPEKSVTE